MCKHFMAGRHRFVSLILVLRNILGKEHTEGFKEHPVTQMGHLGVNGVVNPKGLRYGNVG